MGTSVPKKSQVKAGKSFKDGHVKLRVDAGARGWHGDVEVSASVSVDLDLSTAKQLQIDLATAIEKEAAKMAAHQDRQARRKAWRDREVAAGRMQVVSLTDIFKR